MAGAAGGGEAEARTRRLRRGGVDRVGRTVSGEEDAEGSETDAAGEAVRHSRRAENSEGGVCLGRCSARPRPC